MNKNIIKTGTLLLAALSFSLVACNRILDEVDPVTAENGTGEVTEVLTLLNEPQTKATLSNDVSPVKAWEDGDLIAVWAGTNASTGSFQNCSLADNSVSVNLYGGTYKRFNYAVYPNKYSAEGSVIPSYNAATGALSLNLPAEYDYYMVGGTKNPVPMVAKNLWSDGATLTFYAVGALARISVAAIPSRANKLVVSFDKTVTGSFEVQNLSHLGGDNDPYIAIDAESAPSTVTVNLTPGANYINAAVNIPIPQGNINVISVAVYEDDTLLFIQGDNEHKVITNWSATRAHGKKGSVEYPHTIASLYIASGNLYTDGGGNLLISDKWYKNMYVFSGNAVDEDGNGVADDPTVNSFGYDRPGMYSIANRTHFNWNETYYLMHNTTPDLAKSQDNTVGGACENIETGYPMSRSDFGDGFTWHVPSKAEFRAMWNNRNGGKINGFRTRCVKLLVTDMVEDEKNIGTSRLFTDYTYKDVHYDELAMNQGKNSITTRYPYQSGVLFLPDNVEIETTAETFTVFDASSMSYSAIYNLTKITKANLDDLIDQGCAFFPALGHYTPWFKPNTEPAERYMFNGVGRFGIYWSIDQGNNPTGTEYPFDDYSEGACYLGMDYNSLNISPAHKIDFGSVRLVRELK